MLCGGRNYSPDRARLCPQIGLAAGDALSRKPASAADDRGAIDHHGAVWQLRGARYGPIGTRCLVGAKDTGRSSEIGRAPDLPEQTDPNAPEIPSSGRRPDAIGEPCRYDRCGSELWIERHAVER